MGATIHYFYVTFLNNRVWSRWFNFRVLIRDLQQRAVSVSM